MARTTSSLKHTHKYYRMEDSGLWYCSGYNGCTHYMPKNMPPPTGRMSLCWGCEKPFQLAPYNMEDTHPKCDDCMEALLTIEAIEEGRTENVGFSTVGMTPKTIEMYKQAIARHKTEDNSIVSPSPVIKLVPKITKSDDTDSHAADCDSWAGGECSCR